MTRKRDYEYRERGGFVLYTQQLAGFSMLSNEQLGRLIRHIFQYQAEGQADPEDDIIIPFDIVAVQFRIDDAKYLERCKKNKEAIQKRWSTNEYNRIQMNSINTDKDKDKDKDKKRDIDKSLIIPYPDNVEFVETWNELREQPKWKKKTTQALQMSLSKLGKYRVEFAIQLMQSAIENGWQGVEYNDTPAKYEKWLQSQPQRSESNYERVEVITDESQLYN